MLSRRNLLWSVGAGTAFLSEAAAVGSVTARPTCVSPLPVSCSLTTHAFAIQIVACSEAMPDLYRIALNVGADPELTLKKVPIAIERQLAEFIALTTTQWVLPSAVFDTEFRQLAERERTADLASAEELARSVYLAARRATTDTAVPGGTECAHMCAHHCLCSLGSTSSDNERFLAGAGKSAAWAVFHLHSRHHEAGFETTWIWDECLAVLKSMLQLEQELLSDRHKVSLNPSA